MNKIKSITFLTMTSRSATSCLWMLIKSQFSWTGSSATIHELFDWVNASMRGRQTEFNGDKLTRVSDNFCDTQLGKFMDALRETPNLDKFPDMPPRMMYLTLYITNRRIDFHPDAIERAIEEDHLVVRDLISIMGGNAYLEFVRERNIPLGADSLQYLGQHSDLSREEKNSFWCEYVSIVNKLSWISLFLQPVYMTYLIVKIAVILFMVLVIPALVAEFMTTVLYIMEIDDRPFCTPNEGMQQFIEACVESFQIMKCQTWPYVAPVVCHWM